MAALTRLGACRLIAAAAAPSFRPLRPATSRPSFTGWGMHGMRGAHGADRGVWTTAGAVSLAAHIALLGLAIWLLGRNRPPPAEAQALNVRIVTLTPSRRPRSEAPAQDVPPALDPARPAPRPAANVQDEATPLPSATSPDPAVGVARALRSRLGCRQADPVRMTAEERERCRTALADAGVARDGPAPRLDLSRQGRIAEDPDFDLSRRPKNGCKLRAAGSRDPMGKEGAAMGVSCALSF